MPAAALGGQVRRPRAVRPRATRCRRRRAPRCRPTSSRRSTCSGPTSVIVREGRDRAAQARHGDPRSAARTPVANAIAFARFSDGGFGWGVVDPGHGLVFANAEPPARRGRRRAAVGERHVRPAAARRRRRRARRAARRLPARHPAGLRERPGARRLQSRLDHRRRDGDVDRRAVADRRACSRSCPGQHAQNAERRHEPRPSSPSASRPPRSRVEDVRQLMGASTPHFALQLRNRIARLIAGLPAGPPGARSRASARSRA